MRNYERMLEDCLDVKNVSKNNGGPGYNEWEKEFLDSMRSLRDRGQLNNASEKQRQILENLHDKI